MRIPHSFILTFSTESNRSIYLEYADHRAHGLDPGPVLEVVFVIDFCAT